MTRTGAQEPFASELRLNPQECELSITFTDRSAGRLSAELLARGEPQRGGAGPLAIGTQARAR